MRRAMGMLQILVLLVAIVNGMSLASALYGPSSDVVILTSSNFKSKVLQADGVVLVEFFANWCGHCKNLAPQWEKVATALKGIVTVAAVDADTHRDLAQEYGIQGFPTIKLFGLGKSPVDYQGAREAKPIVEYALQQSKSLALDRLSGKSGMGSKKSGGKKDGGASASVDLTTANFDKLVIQSDDIWLVEFFAPWCGHCKKLAPEWKTAAKNLKGKVKLGQVDCDAETSLAQKYGVKGFPTIMLFAHDKQNPSLYEGARVAGAIESYALSQLELKVVAPEVLELAGQDVLENECGSAAICFVTFLPDILDSKKEGRNKYIEVLHTVAEKFKRNAYRYVWAAAGKQPELEKAVGVGGYGYPAMVALNIKKAVYAPLRSSFDLDSVVKFVSEAGKGGKGNLPLNEVPVIVTTEPWDGNDGVLLEEDEFSLDELMGVDNKDDKEEL
ncbi:unnamed protein product [Sphagnum jensenii]|uniref:protein disulfide-isomerase n=1 Tax=Sphagnum jensenii TaxID=128206 RepID=A0ABP0W178_9BRYO